MNSLTLRSEQDPEDGNLRLTDRIKQRTKNMKRTRNANTTRWLRRAEGKPLVCGWRERTLSRASEETESFWCPHNLGGFLIGGKKGGVLLIKRKSRLIRPDRFSNALTFSDKHEIFNLSLSFVNAFARPSDLFHEALFM
jgi:hypothetical protein